MKFCSKGGPWAQVRLCRWQEAHQNAAYSSRNAPVKVLCRGITKCSPKLSAPIRKTTIFHKFDLWCVISGSNIDLEAEILCPFARSRWNQSDGCCCEALRRLIYKLRLDWQKIIINMAFFKNEKKIFIDRTTFQFFYCRHTIV